MLRSLRWRIVIASGAAALFGQLALVSALVQTGLLPTTAHATSGILAFVFALALGVGLVVSLPLSRLAAGPIERSARGIEAWARSLTTAGASSTLSVDSDFDQVARALREAARAIASEGDLIRAERSRMAVALDHMESGVVVLDGNFRIILLNPAAARLLSVPSGRAEGRSLIEVARDHELLAVADASRSPSSRPEGDAITVLELGEPRRTIQVLGTAIPAGAGTPAGGNIEPGVLLLLQDVTQLRQADVVRREFVANVSHELRTPLAGLKALAETLEAGALDDPPAAREFLQQMLIEVDRLTELVSELLELARLESGQPSLLSEMVDLRQLAQRAADRLRARGEQVGVKFAVDDSEPGCVVRGDGPRLERVFVNLLENAVKYSPADTTVEVRFEKSDSEVRVAVKDEGAGIPASDLSRIFERFYKADKARSSPGSGLGLAIVKHTIQAHGGRVWAESSEGTGSTFFFSLPTPDR